MNFQIDNNSFIILALIFSFSGTLTVLLWYNGRTHKLLLTLTIIVSVAIIMILLFEKIGTYLSWICSFFLALMLTYKNINDILKLQY